MGTITRSFANNLTTNGILKANAFNNASLNNVTAFNAAVQSGGMKLISSQTASNSATVSFTTGIDSTYKEYQFWFLDIHPRTDLVNFTFNMSTDSGSNYNVTKTSTSFSFYHYENDLASDVSYVAATGDLAQSTAFQNLTSYNLITNSGDSVITGTLKLFNPSSTTYVKHFIGAVHSMQDDAGRPFSLETNTAGYGNTTSAINAVRFQMTSGNFDGTILMYGIV